MVSKEEKIKSETMKHHLILKVITKFMVGVIVLCSFMEITLLEEVSKLA